MLLAKTNGLGLSLELHHLLGQELDDLHIVLFKQFHVVVSQAQVLAELSSLEGLTADVTLNLNCRAMLLDMVPQLCSCHVLEFLEVTNITTVLWTFIVLCVLLQLGNGHPSDFAIWGLVALVRELTEVDQVSYNWVNLLEKLFTFGLAMWALETVILISLSIVIKSFSIVFTCS